jgi:hypothetical protein
VVTLSIGGGKSAEISCGKENNVIANNDTTQRTLNILIVDYSETHKPLKIFPILEI